MHICFITDEYPKTGFPHGGIGSFVQTIGTELVKNGIKVSVLGINYTNEYEYLDENGIAIYRLKPKKVKGVTWLFNSIAIHKKIKEIHQQNPISIIETQEAGLAFFKKIKEIKYIIRLHGGHYFFAESENRSINKWKGFQEKLSFAKADGFVAVSKFVKKHTNKYLSFHNKTIAEISSPINTVVFQPIETEIIENNIVFVGSVCEKKGIRQLIQAFGLVKKQYPKAILNIYGRDWFFANGDSFIEMLKSNELPKLGIFANDIHFNGTIPYLDLPKKYAQAEVCVFPSHMETQGLVAPEAMSMEKTVVFTNLGPGSEVISDYETGLLCNPHDINDIAEKICWVFANKEKSKQIGINARKFVLNNYLLENSVNLNLEFYKQIIQN